MWTAATALIATLKFDLMDVEKFVPFGFKFTPQNKYQARPILASLGEGKTKVTKEANMGSKENQVITLTPTLSEEDEACLQAMLFSSTQLFPSVLNAAIELNLFGIIAEAGPAACMTPSEIASQLPTHDSNAPSRLDRMLRLLASHSVLTCSIRTLEDGKVERLYGLTPACHFFLRKEDGCSLVSFSAFTSQRAVREVWYA